MFRLFYCYFIPKFIKNKFNWMTILKILANRNQLLNLLPKNAIAAELGVDEGEFSEQILKICLPRKLHLIDAWNSEQYGLDKLSKTKKRLDSYNKDTIILHQGFSYVELENFEDNYFDWVYIDTDHRYETTVKELEVCLRKIKVDGVIAGHDYVTRCYYNYTRYGVVEAVNEFCINNNWEIIYLTNETNRHISYALRKITE